jgi:hypothetical protein
MYKNMKSEIKNTQKDPSFSRRQAAPKGMCPNA